MENSTKELLERLALSKSERVRASAERIRILYDAADDLCANVVPQAGRNPSVIDEWRKKWSQKMIEYDAARKSNISKLLPGGIIVNRAWLNGSAKIEEGEFIINPKEASKTGQWFEKNL